MDDDALKQLLDRAAAAVAGLPAELRPVAFSEVFRVLAGGTGPGQAPSESSKTRKKTPIAKKPAKTAARSGKTASPSLDRNLDLRPSGKQSLADFYSAKAPKNQDDNNVTFVYYLEMVAEIEGVGVDQVFTCYKEVKAKLPSDLRNSLQLTSSKQGWINTGSMDALSVTPRGQNVVDHELPRQKASS